MMRADMSNVWSRVESENVDMQIIDESFINDPWNNLWNNLFPK